ncbi:transmembrane protein 135-like [Pollicipes pollicipes]|uniref:transmembrane protein 135-like n=1 Tax=Pollicipes pollicipes TaxID=41117 RepID=UPI001885A26B|nr:transmembrane protein 135-like [Pollicipes pollicipes]
MIVASKLSSYPCGCHEVAHAWTSSCFKSWLDVGVPGITEAAKIYLPLFIISRLVKSRKWNAEMVLKIFKETVQSSAFLGANCYFLLSSFCTVRWLLPFVPVREGIMLACVVSSYMSIMIERESRRDVLTVYMMNVASETLFNFLLEQGLVPNIPHGRSLLASVALAAMMYLYKLGRSEALVGQLAQALLGTAEIYPPRAGSCRKDLTAGMKLFNYISSMITGKPQITTQSSQSSDRPLSVPAHPGLCPHHGACLRYAWRGLTESLLLGVAVQAGVTGGGALLRLASSGRRPLLPSPVVLLPLGLCLGSVSGLFRLASCLLRRWRGRDAAWHAVPAGLLAAAGLRFYNSPSLTLYLFWKTAEAWYAHGAASGRLPRAPGAVPLLYALSTGVVLSAAVLEPHQISRSYWAFLRTLTGGRVAQMNRALIARQCGTDSLRLADVRAFRPTFRPEDVRAASLPILRELGQLV